MLEKDNREQKLITDINSMSDSIKKDGTYDKFMSIWNKEKEEKEKEINNYLDIVDKYRKDSTLKKDYEYFLAIYFLVFKNQKIEKELINEAIDFFKTESANNIKSKFIYGTLLNLCGDYEEAAKYLKEAVNSDYTDAVTDYTNLLIDILAKNEKEPEKALEYYEEAIKYLLEGIKRNNSTSMYNLARLLDLNRFTTCVQKVCEQKGKEYFGEKYPNITKIYLSAQDLFKYKEDLYKRSLESGNNLGLLGLGFINKRNKNKEEAIKYFKESAETGNIDGMYQYGLQLLELQRKKEALAVFNVAAEEGHAPSAIKAADIQIEMDDTQGAEENLNKAISNAKDEETKVKAEIGLVRVSNKKPNKPKEDKDKTKKLKENLRNNIKNPKLNNETKLEMLKALADSKENADDIYNYAEALYNGTYGAKINKTEAFKRYLEAAKMGHTKSMVKIGLMLKNGDGIEKNPEEAVKWFKNAADNGNKEGMFYYANALLLGDGIEKNPEEAAKLFKTLADNSDSDQIVITSARIYARIKENESEKNGDNNSKKKKLEEAKKYYNKVGDAESVERIEEKIEGEKAEEIEMKEKDKEEEVKIFEKQEERAKNEKIATNLQNEENEKLESLNDSELDSTDFIVNFMDSVELILNEQNIADIEDAEVDNQLNKAIKLYNKAIESGYKPDDEEVELYKKIKLIKKARKILKDEGPCVREATIGDNLYFLSIAYLYKLTEKGRDLEKAKLYYEIALELGNENAINYLEKFKEDYEKYLEDVEAEKIEIEENEKAEDLQQQFIVPEIIKEIETSGRVEIDYLIDLSKEANSKDLVNDQYFMKKSALSEINNNQELSNEKVNNNTQELNNGKINNTKGFGGSGKLHKNSKKITKFHFLEDSFAVEAIESQKNEDYEKNPELREKDLNLLKNNVEINFENLNEEQINTFLVLFKIDVYAALEKVLENGGEIIIQNSENQEEDLTRYLNCMEHITNLRRYLESVRDYENINVILDDKSEDLFKEIRDGIPQDYQKLEEKDLVNLTNFNNFIVEAVESGNQEQFFTNNRSKIENNPYIEKLYNIIDKYNSENLSESLDYYSSGEELII